MRSLLLAAALLALPALVCAQGSLTPPGAPAPTMKTLDQLEPRTPLQAGAPGVTANANGGFTIASPGSYYLTGNLTVASGSAITITTSNVTLDLRGFTIASTSATTPASNETQTCAIALSGPASNVAIEHGHIASGTTLLNNVFALSGFSTGIFANDAHACRVTDIEISGTASAGIVLPLDSSNEVRDCSVSLCSGFGIYASTVIHCTAESCGFAGIVANTALDSSARSETTSVSMGGLSARNAVNCYGYGRGSAPGLQAANALNCFGQSEHGIGLNAQTATNCSGLSGLGIGLSADLSATGCIGHSSGPYAIQVTGTAENCHGIINDGTGTALAATTALNCRGEALGGTGLKAQTATNCVGTTTGNGVGLDAETATGCRGESVNNTGLRTDASAENCRGIATGSGYGLYSGGTATNCTGVTHSGAYGLYSVGTANTCRGKNDGAGAVDFSLHAGIAVACTSEKGVIESPSKQLGTP